MASPPPLSCSLFLCFVLIAPLKAQRVQRAERQAILSNSLNEDMGRESPDRPLGLLGHSPEGGLDGNESMNEDIMNDDPAMMNVLHADGTIELTGGPSSSSSSSSSASASASAAAHPSSSSTSSSAHSSYSSGGSSSTSSLSAAASTSRHGHAMGGAGGGGGLSPKASDSAAAFASDSESQHEDQGSQHVLHDAHAEALANV